MFLSIKEQVPRKVLASQTTTFTRQNVYIGGYTELFYWPLQDNWNVRYFHLNTVMPLEHSKRTEPPKWSWLPIRIRNRALCDCRSSWRAWWKGKRLSYLTLRETEQQNHYWQNHTFSCGIWISLQVQNHQYQQSLTNTRFNNTSTLDKHKITTRLQDAHAKTR